MSTQNYKTLDPTVVQQLLEGAESSMETISESDQRAREAISMETCPHCNGQLTPKLPNDTNQIFNPRGGINYRPWCRICRLFI